ncbi:hypothetical protein [Paenibacillus sp. MER 99-2]|uniref:hypothetical protein n=1 Tax=Paenibacillus sp. MER 99-2 TaxID=2939572 RepID=UPI0020413B36|nr:hypothetical protein [Paenibacillus sp. MER 99-2]MCM3176231.1 hypothetical protein [Paenibacillus sp. MER 99-2]
MSGFNIKEITSDGVGKIKGMFKGKKGKITLVVVIVLGLVVFLALRNRSSSSQSVPVALSGYPSDGMPSGGGAGGGSMDTSGFDDAISNINKNFADLLQQNNQDAQRLMQEMQNANVNQYNAMQNAFDQMSGSYSNQFQSMQGMIDGMNAEFQKQYLNFEQQNKTLTDQLQSFKDRQAQQSIQYPSASSSSSSSSSSSNSSNWMTGSTLQQAKNEVIASNNWSQQTQNYLNGIVSSQSTSSMYQAAQTAESNLSSQKWQDAKDAFKPSTPTPGVAQASVAKVEVLGTKKK